MRNIIIVVLIALCAFFAYKFYSSEKKDPATEKIADSAREMVKAEVENITKKVGDNGIERALIDDEKQVAQSINDIDSTSRKETDSLKRIVGIRDNQIISLTSVISRLKAENLKAVNSGDSVYTYSDSFAHISFNRPSETFSLQYDAKIDMAEYWKRTWFLAPKKRYLELWMSDPRATINGVKRLRFEPKADNFKVQLKGISDYSGKHKEIYVGGGVEVETRRFEYQGNYLYDFSTNKWYPGFRVGLKLVEF